MKKEYVPTTAELIHLNLDENIAISDEHFVPELRPGEIFPDDEDNEGF